MPRQSPATFLLQIVQPGVLGLIDGSVSTLAPLLSTVLLTGVPFDAFRVGAATAVGAGISMAMSEALSDDGKITGRGSAWKRGLVVGAMTAIGGLGHTLPFLIPVERTALIVAGVVIACELAAIAIIRHRFFKTNLWASIAQVFLGGALVVLAGVLFGGV